MRAPRAVLVSLYEAFPPASGAANVTYGLARALPGWRAIVQAAPRAYRGTSPEGVEIVGVPSPRGRFDRLRRLASLLARIAARCRTLAPDRVIIEGASWAPYLWALWRRLRGVLPRTPLVYHAHNVEYTLRLQRHGPLIAWLTRQAEGALFRRAALGTVVSEVDRAQITALYGVRPALLPNGVDAERFARVGAAELAAARRRYGLGPEAVLFMGLQGYPPNDRAVARLVHEIWPRVRARRPAAQLVLLGGYRARREQGIVCPGLVPWQEVPAVVRACALGVAPIDSGSGTRVKILEYGAAGLPVVATARAAEGLLLRDGEHLLVAEQDERFSAEIVRLLGERELAGRLGRSAQALVREHYDWPVLARRFAAELTALGAGPP
ncbi:MAG: hypothetical protein KatS3mg102_2661 [Planctomycetota bacterium]|nr:MAG: hypothetical protein KatS3mg102_2661 [Planctomycetota bacterium]